MWYTRRMNITRRNFFIGGVAGALGAFGGNRFFATANLKTDSKPKLRFGVVSDIHIRHVGADEKMESKNYNNLTFRHTLEWFRAPEFPAGATLTVTRVKARTRGGKSRDGKEKISQVKKAAFHVATPPAVPDKNARLFKLEFVAEMADGKKVTKLTLAPGFNHALAHPNAKDAPFCQFALDELGKGDIRFTATPMNCFGQRGKPITATAKV